MKCDHHCCYLPVRPLLCHFTVSEGQGADQVVDEDDAVVDLKRAAVLGEPIVGIEQVTLDERGQGAVNFKILPSPKEPTPAQRERHNICHWPYEAWCPICVSTRRPNDHHRACKRMDHEIPFLVGDSAFSVTQATMRWSAYV